MAVDVRPTAMLEGVLAGVIERLAGKYVDGIDKKAAGSDPPPTLRLFFRNPPPSEPLRRFPFDLT